MLTKGQQVDLCEAAREALGFSPKYVSVADGEFNGKELTAVLFVGLPFWRYWAWKRNVERVQAAVAAARPAHRDVVVRPLWRWR